jgi:flagellar biosynthesis protein FliR
MGWIEAVALAGVRVTAFVVIAPPFSHNAIPMRIKAMLGIGLGVAVAPRVTDQYVSQEIGAFLMALTGELVVGLALGFLVMLAFSAVQSAGAMIDLFGGFSLAQGFDPMSQVNGAQFSKLFHLLALALLFVTDGYQLVLGGLFRSFGAIPVGAGLDMPATGELMLGGLGQMFLAALQIAAPLIVVLFLADAGLGLLTRVAPALNAFALGFPLKILLTIVFAGVVVSALPGIVEALTDDAVQTILGVR